MVPRCWSPPNKHRSWRVPSAAGTAKSYRNNTPDTPPDREPAFPACTRQRNSMRTPKTDCSRSSHRSRTGSRPRRKTRNFPTESADTYPSRKSVHCSRLVCRGSPRSQHQWCRRLMRNCLRKSMILLRMSLPSSATNHRNFARNLRNFGRNHQSSARNLRNFGRNHQSSATIPPSSARNHQSSATNHRNFATILRWMSPRCLGNCRRRKTGCSRHSRRCSQDTTALMKDRHRDPGCTSQKDCRRSRQSRTPAEEADRAR